jgi:hypothetical protein
MWGTFPLGGGWHFGLFCQKNFSWQKNPNVDVDKFLEIREGGVMRVFYFYPHPKHPNTHPSHLCNWWTYSVDLYYSHSPSCFSFKFMEPLSAFNHFRWFFMPFLKLWWQLHVLFFICSTFPAFLLFLIAYIF